VRLTLQSTGGHWGSEVCRAWARTDHSNAPLCKLRTLVLLFFGCAFLDGLVAFAGSSLKIALVYLVAGWASLTGIFDVIAATRLRRYVTGEWLLAVSLWSASAWPRIQAAILGTRVRWTRGALSG